MKKLTAKEIDERVVRKIFSRIRNLEKKYNPMYIHKACYRYVQSSLEKRKALEDLQNAEERLAEAKRRLNR